jgi:lipopolysaccharide transport system ATP-binding protein
MGKELAISLNNVSKCFKRYEKPIDRLKEILLPNQSSGDNFWALNDISLDIDKGETFGIIGENGSGKSTLLQIIAGILTPSSGEVHVNGRISALLELGSGFNPEFTGTQNVFFNGRLLGLTEQEIKNRFDAIATFADIGIFIDQPVKTYSSGMFVRLAFAVAVNVQPEILIVDEALAVGDIAFQYKCMNKIKQLKNSGTTILFVSHDNSAVSFLCERSIWLSNGKVMEVGFSKQVVNRYIAYLSIPKHNKISEINIAAKNLDEINAQNYQLEVIENIENVDQRMGNQQCQILGVGLFDSQGEQVKSLQHNQKFSLRISLCANNWIDNVLVGFNLSDRLGHHIIETNTDQEEIRLPVLEIGTVLTLEFKLEMPNLRAGHYSFSVDVNNGNEQIHELCDWIVNAVVFECINEKKVYGLIDVNSEIKFNLLKTASSLT